ncbi:MAG TPA: polysaccharide deacetylase family protein [Acidimicrobiales bacterium]|nr:polysaccharide deacetylase family protein [Acidimicrobiales bacterium]
MSSKLSMSIDVEDFYEGMSVLGHEVPRPPGLVDKLDQLVDLLGAEKNAPKVTLFVVGHHASGVRPALTAFAEAGHEIASHGPDHGRLPAKDVVSWLRRGREMLEDLLQVRVTGFRSPRFDLPQHGDLARFRNELAEAGYEYVSDASFLDAGSPVRQAPVMVWRGVRLGGGSYQRMVPFAAVSNAVRQCPGTAVCYYHSYDFDGTTPGLGAVRSTALARQILGRGRIMPIFLRLARQFGSETCFDAAI